jgi:hypothetical protein
MAKYMQIFAFLVRLRHCEQLLSGGWKRLNAHKRLL